MVLRSWLSAWRTKSSQRLSQLASGGRRRGARSQRRAAVSAEFACGENLEPRCLLTTIDLGTLGAAGTTIYGIDIEDSSGRSVSNLGDVNGDFIDDVFIGAPLASSLNNATS